MFPNPPKKNPKKNERPRKELPLGRQRPGRKNSQKEIIREEIPGLPSTAQKTEQRKGGVVMAELSEKPGLHV